MGTAPKVKLFVAGNHQPLIKGTDMESGVAYTSLFTTFMPSLAGIVTISADRRVPCRRSAVAA